MDSPSRTRNRIVDTTSSSSFLLVVSAQSRTLEDGRWQFVIETADGDPVLHADDVEFGDINRLTLLAAVRGLESIDGGAAVTLLSHNRYLIRSLTDSLPRWRRSDFVWDHFGKRVEVQHADLWRRIDRTLQIHDVQACLVTTRKLSHPAAETKSAMQPAPVTPAAAVDASADVPQGDDKPILRVDSAHTTAHSSAPAPASNRRLRNWLLRSAQAGSATVPARTT